jgi:hypothetical protein
MIIWCPDHSIFWVRPILVVTLYVKSQDMKVMKVLKFNYTIKITVKPEKLKDSVNITEFYKHVIQCMKMNSLPIWQNGNHSANNVQENQPVHY